MLEGNPGPFLFICPQRVGLLLLQAGPHCLGLLPENPTKLLKSPGFSRPAQNTEGGGAQKSPQASGRRRSTNMYPAA